MMLINSEGLVFIGQRCDVSNEAWQMPQGGIDPGETPRAAALRELREEIGTDNVDVVVGTRDWLSYELPPKLLERMPSPRWRGQTQQWFLMRFRGADDEIDVATEHPEFSAWRWVPADHLLDLVVPFKRELYRRVLEEFASYISSDRSR
jgi:putative (di)nucleoside polyphosphate hydrolase